MRQPSSPSDASGLPAGRGAFSANGLPAGSERSPMRWVPTLYFVQLHAQEHGRGQ